jgi:hypothetical protein
MSTKYRIEPSGRPFTVTDPLGEQVGVYETEEAAQSAIEHNKREDAMWESAKLLFANAISAHMELHGTDRETSCRLLRDAEEVTD